MSRRQKTRIIAGHPVTLTAGDRYLPTRPIANSKRQTIFPVTIHSIGPDDRTMPVMTIDHLTYEQANRFINEFNNGPISFAGRVW